MCHLAEGEICVGMSNSELLEDSMIRWPKSADQCLEILLSHFEHLDSLIRRPYFFLEDIKDRERAGIDKETLQNVLHG